MGKVKTTTAVVVLGGITLYMAGLGGWPLARWLAGGGWQFARWAGPPLFRTSLAYGAVVGSDAVIMGQAFAATRHGAAITKVGKGGGAVAVGYIAGAAVGTGIIYIAEKEGVVYEGATKDVFAFYSGQSEADYWGNTDWKGKPNSTTVVDPVSGGMSATGGTGIIPREKTPGYFNIPGNLRFIWGRASGSWHPK